VPPGAQHDQVPIVVPVDPEISPVVANVEEDVAVRGEGLHDSHVSVLTAEPP
jgi:hypothetical protein